MWWDVLQHLAGHVNPRIGLMIFEGTSTGKPSFWDVLVVNTWVSYQCSLQRKIN